MKRYIGIDFGSSNTFIVINGKGIVFSEPTIIAEDAKNGEVKELGFLAAKMLGRNPPSIEVITPVERGVISHFKPALDYLKAALIKSGLKSLKGYDLVFAIPSGITEVEKSIFVNLAKQLGTDKVTFENQAMLSALGSGTTSRDNRGSMVINIGGDTTSIAILSGNNVLVDKPSHFSGNLIEESILKYLRKQRSLIIGKKTAEYIKIKIGTVEDVPENRLLEVAGRDILSSLPHNADISTSEVKKLILPLMDNLLDDIGDALSYAPPELAGDISEGGIVIAGGTALLTGFREFLEDHLKMAVRIAPDAMGSVSNGMIKYFKEKESE